MLMGIVILPTTSYAQTNQQVSDEIIAMVKAQWAGQMSDPGNADNFKNVADEYTEFNGDYSTRVDGKALSMRLNEPSAKASGKVVAAEMLNPKVQVYGDVAVLSYNYAGKIQNAAGELKTIRAKSTRVYAKQAGKWKLVHANFAADPQ